MPVNQDLIDLAENGDQDAVKLMMKWGYEGSKKFIGGNPLVGGLDGNNIEPSGYIFSDSKWALLPAKITPENKVNKIVKFIQDLGAKPFFVDSLEHDSYTYDGVYEHNVSDHRPVGIKFLFEP